MSGEYARNKNSLLPMKRRVERACRKQKHGSHILFSKKGIEGVRNEGDAGDKSMYQETNVRKYISFLGTTLGRVVSAIAPPRTVGIRKHARPKNLLVITTG